MAGKFSYICRYCQKSFSNKGDLNSHIEIFNTLEEFYNLCRLHAFSAKERNKVPLARRITDGRLITPTTKGPKQ